MSQNKNTYWWLWENNVVGGEKGEKVVEYQAHIPKESNKVNSA